jgi:hypothetical protein
MSGGDWGGCRCGALGVWEEVGEERGCGSFSREGGRAVRAWGRN